MASLQSGSIDLVERNGLVHLEKQRRLASSKFIQVSVDATALDNIAQVEIRLTVTYEVNFFTDQFLHYFVAAPTQGSGGRAKIDKLFKVPSHCFII